MDQLSQFIPDTDIAGVLANDIGNNSVDPRNIRKKDMPFHVERNVTTGAASIKIFDANAPFAFEILDVIIQPRGASTNGTIKITDGSTDITNAMTCAVDKTIARPATIDDAASTIAADGTLEIVCAGDAVASTIALVTIICVKR